MNMTKLSALKPHARCEYYFDNITGTKWESFKASVQQNGVIVPLITTADGTIVSGYQRYRACKELGIKTVPCEVADFADEDAVLRTMIESNIRQRGIVNQPSVKLGRMMLELERLAGVCGRDSGGGVAHGGTTRAAIRKELGIDNNVAKCSKGLVSMPESVQELVNEGIITPRVAYDNLCRRDVTTEVQESVASFIRSTGATKVTTNMINDAIKHFTGAAKPQTEHGAYSITRNIRGKDVVIDLTDSEVEAIAMRWLEGSGIRITSAPEIKEKEPETKKDWETPKITRTGTLKDHIDEASRMYETGWSAQQIADYFGTSNSTVLDQLRKNGVAIRTRSEAARVFRNGKAA